MHCYAREIVNEAKVLLDHPGLEITSSVTTLVIQALLSCCSKLVKIAEKVCPPFYCDCLEPQGKLSIQGCIQYMMERRAVIYDSSEQHTYFLHGHKDGRLILFAHDGLEALHHQYWYLHENSPLFDEDMREMLTMTMYPMLLLTAVAVMCIIDRYAEDRFLQSGDVIKFRTNPYADKYCSLNLSMEAACNSILHHEPMKLYFQYLHDKGMQLLSDKLGFTSPVLVYLPTSLDGMTQPSAAANTTTSHNTGSHNIALL
ncbi:hypothetical protein BDR06DRAFT_1005968 [Suillus hirtellus]|nr:hypothetical protein BDR06DRAFT_1005968 [Suillus hirtellus]